MDVGERRAGQPDHGGQSAELVVGQGRIGGFQCHVCAAPHGDADAGTLHGGGVVDAIPYHGHLAGLCEPGYLLHLALRQQAGAPLHAELTGDGLGGARVVPGQHDTLQPKLPQLTQSRRGVWPDLVPQRQQRDRCGESSSLSLWERVG
ncbi:hypothetical protein D3C85_1286600 [compost metagenome]